MPLQHSFLQPLNKGDNPRGSERFAQDDQEMGRINTGPETPASSLTTGSYFLSYHRTNAQNSAQTLLPITKPVAPQVKMEGKYLLSKNFYYMPRPKEVSFLACTLSLKQKALLSTLAPQLI